MATSSRTRSSCRAACSTISASLPSYYLHYFYAHDRVLADQQHGVPRAQTVAEIERELLRLYRDPNLNEKPALLEQRGGAFYSEAAVGLVRSLATGDGAVHVVDVRNNGTIAGLADDDVVELPARVTKDGAVPLSQAPLAPELLGLVQHVAAYERLTVEAATTRDHVAARKALLAHPLIGQVEMVDGLVDALVARGGAMSALLLAVDGGNAKTDLALVAADGSVLALVRGPGSSPHEHRARRRTRPHRGAADRGGADGPVAYAELLLAGVDFPAEVEAVQRRARERGWADRVEVANDTFAVLRAGHRARLGRRRRLRRGDQLPRALARRPPGALSGARRDHRRLGRWPGRGRRGASRRRHVARTAAARRRRSNGSCPSTSGCDAAAAGGGHPHRRDLAAALRRARADRPRDGCDGRRVAAGIVARLAEEVVSLVRVALERIGEVDEPADVVLGGGLMQARNPRLLDGIATGLAALGLPHALAVVDAPPVVGAALRALDTLGAGPRRAPACGARSPTDERLAEVVRG